MIRLECPCGEVARIPSALAGHAGRCVRCGGALLAPGDPIVPAAPLPRTVRPLRRPGDASASGEVALDLTDTAPAPGPEPSPAPARDEPAARAFTPLRVLHAEVDGAALTLAARLGPRLQCRRGCASCCVDGLTVFEVEAARIREAARDLLERGTPHAPGACAFLDEAGACRIYADRPYVCRTQGLPLRWLEERQSETVEMRDVCPLNLTDEEGPPLEALAAEECWTIGPVEARLAALQAAQDGGALRRVALRDLFTYRGGEAGRGEDGASSSSRPS